MLSAREYIDITITRRLNKVKDTDIEVDYLQFNKVMGELDNLINNLSTQTRIEGFTPEDLESFFSMQVHQSLRRGKYDPERKAFSFFMKSFTNLLRDIVRMRNNCIKNHLCVDPLDQAIFYKENNKLF